MFNRLFRKRRKHEDIETEITKAVNDIIGMQTGKRDFSELLELDEELVNSDRFAGIMAIAFEEMVKQAENAFFCNVDIQLVLDYLKDISTFPNNAYQGQANIWLTNKTLFEQGFQRYKSILNPTQNIQEQFDDLKNHVELYDKDFRTVTNLLAESIGKFKMRDDFDKSDLDGAYNRYSILTGLMLADINKNQIISVRKALISFALNYDLDGAAQAYNICKKDFYGLYVNLTKDDKTAVPATDIIIANGILEAYHDEQLSSEEFHKNTIEMETYTREFSNVPEMKEQLQLIVNVYKYLGLYGGTK